MSDDFAVEKPSMGFNISFITHLTPNYINALLDVSYVAMVARNSGLDGYEKKGVFAGDCAEPTIDELADLPLYESRYPPEIHTNLYTSKSLVAIDSFNDLVRSFNSRPKNYSLSELEEHLEEFQVALYGYSKNIHSPADLRNDLELRRKELLNYKLLRDGI